MLYLGSPERVGVGRSTGVLMGFQLLLGPCESGTMRLGVFTNVQAPNGVPDLVCPWSPQEERCPQARSFSWCILRASRAIERQQLMKLR